MTEARSDTLIKVTLALLGVIQAGVFFIIGNLYRDIETLHQSQADQRTYNTETYARRDDVKDMKQEILKAIDDLSMKLD